MKPTTPGARIEAVLRGFRGKGTAKLVLVAVASHDGEGGSWPSIDTIALYASVDRRNVRRAIDGLVADGWLVVKANEGGTRDTRDDRRPNLYTVDYDRLLEALTDEGAPAPSRSGESANNGGARTTPTGGRSRSHGGAPAPPEQDRTGHEQDVASDDAAGNVRNLWGEPNEPTPEDPAKAMAKRLADAIFAKKQPKPAGRNAYLGVRDVALALLAVDHEPRHIYEAMMTVGTISIRSMEIELARMYPPAPGTGESREQVRER